MAVTYLRSIVLCAIAWHAVSAGTWLALSGNFAPTAVLFIEGVEDGDDDEFHDLFLGESEQPAERELLVGRASIILPDANIAAPCGHHRQRGPPEFELRSF
jgi:hypothetical protein